LFQEGIGRVIKKVFLGGLASFLLASAVLLAQSPPARFFRVKADNGEVDIERITPQGVMSWTASGVSGTSRVEFTDDLTAPNAWRVYAYVQANEGRALVHVFDPFSSVDFTYVPAGSYTRGSPMGEPARQSDENQHEVRLTRPFQIQRTTVTWEQWNELRMWALDNGYTDLPEGIPGTEFAGGKDHPVTGVNWFDVVKWLNAWSESEGWIPSYTVSNAAYREGEPADITFDPVANGYRLPTEAEWEYAARAGTTTAFWSGDITHTGMSPLDPALDAVGWYAGNSGFQTQPVGGKDANPWGLYDVHGNVWEWCWDWYGPYPLVAVTNPVGGIASDGRIARGGSWAAFAQVCRAAQRVEYAQTNRYDFIGFRPVRSESPIIRLTPQIDFADTATDEIREMSLLIENIGTGLLNVLGFNLPEGYRINWTGTLLPGESYLATVFFEPTADANYASTITAFSDTTDGSPDIIVTGLGVPRTLELRIDGDFGIAATESTAVRFLELNNPRTVPVTVERLETPSGFISSWSGTIQPVSIEYAPIYFMPETADIYDGDLIAVSDAAISTAYVSLSGTGTIPPEVTDSFVRIPPGRYLRGSPADEVGRQADEEQHEVVLEAELKVQNVPVTWAQWIQVRSWALQNAYPDIPVGQRGTYSSGNTEHPVTGINWFDAVKWLNAKSELHGLGPAYRTAGDIYRVGQPAHIKLDLLATGYRLPTEAEWEYVARAGTDTAFFSGPIDYEDSGPRPEALDLVGWYAGNSGGNTRPVGQSPVNPWGLHDIHGLVSEWTWDWHGPYLVGSFTNPVGPEIGTERVARGGSWSSNLENSRAASRMSRSAPQEGADTLGFRPVRTFWRIIELSRPLDFGGIDVDTTVTRNLQIANLGNDILMVTDINMPVGFSVEWNSGSIPPSSIQTVAVTFSPSAAQIYSGLIAVESDATSGDSELAILGIGLARVIVTTSALDFGEIDVDTSATRHLQIANLGNDTLTVTDITVPADFSVEWSAGSILPGSTQAVVVTFSPTAGRNYSGFVVIDSDATSGDRTISISGTGLERVIDLTGALDFGEVDVDITATRNLHIANLGNDTLMVTDITLPADFSADWSSGGIPPGSTQTVAVTFSPTAGQVYSGFLEIESDATSGDSELAISGTGLARVIALAGDLDFGAVDVDTTASRNLHIINTGNGNLTVTDVTVPIGFSVDWKEGSILPSGTQIVAVTFSPSSGQFYSGLVEVVSDATSGDRTFSLSGAGLERVIDLTGALDFGEVDVDITATRDLHIANLGNDTLTVTDITMPVGFSVDWSAGNILPGSNQTVAVTFSPAAGQVYSGFIAVESDATSGDGTLGIMGTGLARVFALTGDLAFGGVDVDTTATRNLHIMNTGNGNLTVTDVTAPIGFSVDWKEGTILRGSTQIVAVTFSPSSGQIYSGLVEVVSDATSSDRTFPISGTGLERVIDLTGALDFGEVDVDTIKTRNLNIANLGNDTLMVTDITVPVGFSVDWSVGSVSPTSTQIVAVTFSPVLAEPYTGDIVVESSATGGKKTIAVNGIGGPLPKPAVASLVFDPFCGYFPTGTLQVTIECETEGAVIHFTTDGSEPDQLLSPSIAAGESVMVNVPGTLKAKAWKDDMFPSDTQIVDYVEMPELGGAGYNFCNIELLTDVIRLKWLSNPGDSFYIEYSDALKSEYWTNLAGPLFSVGSYAHTYIDSQRHSFFRLLIAAEGVDFILSRNVVGYIRHEVAANDAKLLVQTFVPLSGQAPRAIDWFGDQLPDGSEIHLWNVDRKQFNVIRRRAGGWIGPIEERLTLGRVFWIVNNSDLDLDIFLMGEVPTDPESISILVSPGLNALGNSYPVDIPLSELSLNLDARSGDTIQVGPPLTSSFDSNLSSIYTFDSGAWSPPNGVIPAGQGFYFVRNTGSSFEWSEHKPYNWP
jgi:formylglycine-generating enzyme required for sulfatase activity